MSVNFNSAPMRSKAIASLDHASFRVYYVLQQHCVELRSTRIAAPSFTQLHSAIAPNAAESASECSANLCSRWSLPDS